MENVEKRVHNNNKNYIQTSWNRHYLNQWEQDSLSWIAGYLHGKVKLDYLEF